MRYVNPKAFAAAIHYQNTCLANNYVIQLTHITEEQMSNCASHCVKGLGDGGTVGIGVGSGVRFGDGGGDTGTGDGGSVGCGVGSGVGFGDGGADTGTR